MASLSSNKDIFRKHFGQSGNQIDPSGGEFDAPNDFFMNEIGRDSGPFKVSVAKKLSQLKDQEFAVTKAKANSNNINLVHSQKNRIDSQEDRLKPLSKNDISSLASINPVDYAEMGSGGPGTAADDQRVHEAAYVAEKWKAALDQGFQNLKTQCYYVLAKKINQKEIQVKPIKIQETLIAELEQVKTYKMDSDGKLMVLPKDKVKEILGRSPDMSDAIMMRMYYEIGNTGEYYVY